MTIQTVDRQFCWSACSAGSNFCSIMERLPVKFISFYGIWKGNLAFFMTEDFFYLKYFYWTLKYFKEMDQVHQPLKSTPSAPNAAMEGDAWCDQLFRKRDWNLDELLCLCLFVLWISGSYTVPYWHMGKMCCGRLHFKAFFSDGWLTTWCLFKNSLL